MRHLAGLLAILAAAVLQAATPRSLSYARLPLAFERSGNDYVTHANGALISLHGGSATIHASGAVSMGFLGARAVHGRPGRELRGRVNYLRGSDPKHWRLGISTYDSVTYSGIYRGIDVVYHGNQRQLEFDLVVRPGARTDRILMQFTDVSGVALGSGGALRLTSPAGELRFPPPMVYQRIGVNCKLVAAKYVLLSNHQVAFQIGDYDRTKPLVIDPTIVYDTLIGGGTGATTSYAVAVDGAGDAFITGTTNAADLPIVNAAYPQLNATGNYSAFVSKLDPTGETIVYSTYINGQGLNGTMQSIAVDSLGDAWIAGSSASTAFPVINGPQTAPNNISAVVMKLDPSGAPQFSTYWGSYCSGNAIAVDGNGNAYLLGYGNAGSLTQVSTTSGAYQQNNPQVGAAAFVTKFNPSGGVVYSTYLGGGNASAIAVDSAGNAYITGTGYSNSFQNVPSGGAQPANAGISNAFIAKLNAAGGALDYFTFLGGSGSDSGAAIAVDSNGNAYIGGSTNSANFPVTSGALETAFGGGTDGFVAKLNSTGSAFNYVTYVGGNRVESVAAIAVDPNGDAYVTGQTDSANFPVASALNGALSGNAYSLYQTTNAGTSWAAADGTIPGAVTSISPDPTTAGVIVAGTEAGIFRSTDGGQTWKQTSKLTNAFLARSPVNPAIIFEIDSYTSRNVSQDGGQTWAYFGQCCPMSSYNYVEATRIVADGANANVAWVYEPGVAGVEEVLNGAVIYEGTDLYAGAQTVVTGSDGSLYADTPFGVYKSSAGLVNTGLPSGESPPNGLAISLSNPSVLYKDLGNQVYVTTNDGGNWALAGSAPVPLGALAVSATNPSLVYAAAPNDSPATYVSTDGGATWTPSGTALGAAGVYQIVPDPFNSSAAYALAPVEPVAFAAEINPTGTGFVYATYLGSFGSLFGYGVAVNNSGDAIVTGEGSSTFPTPVPAGFLVYLTPQAFVARISGSTPGCTFSVSSAAQVVYSSASQLNFTLTAPSGCTWTASSDQSWADVASSASGTGSALLFVDVAANNTGASRTANIFVGNQTFSVTQAAPSCTYSLNQSTFTVGSNGGLVQTVINTGDGCPWSVVNPYPNVVTITSGATGVNSGPVALNVAANAQVNARTLYINVGTAQLSITESSPCAFTQDASPDVSDLRQIIDEALGVVSSAHDLNHDGMVNVIDVQIVMNAALHLGCTVPQ